MVALKSWLHHDASAHTSYLFIVKDRSFTDAFRCQSSTTKNSGGFLSGSPPDRLLFRISTPVLERAAHYTPTTLPVNDIGALITLGRPSEGAL
jgi:hypothetical protein